MDPISNLTFTIPNLKSGADKRWENTFIFDEDTLRHLHQILENYADQLPAKLIIVFEVRRKDDRFYQTLDLEEVLSDPNISPKTISDLSIGLYYPPGTTVHPDSGEENGVVQILYKKWEGISGIRYPFQIFLNIVSDNHKWALSLSDEIEPHIIGTFTRNKIPRWIFTIFLLPFLMFTASMSSSPERFFVFTTFGIVGVGVVVFVAIKIIELLASPGWANRWFGPESAFLWGDEGRRYFVHEANRRKVRWSIAIGFIVSVVISGALLLQNAP